jgi:hypothetical protein
VRLATENAITPLQPEGGESGRQKANVSDSDATSRSGRSTRSICSSSVRYAATGIAGVVALDRFLNGGVAAARARLPIARARRSRSDTSNWVYGR